MLATTPVTQAQYTALMGRNPSRFQGERGGAPDHPVENVSWFDAVAYCNALSKKERLTCAYDAAHKRVSEADGYYLPTEAQWEYAARAGTTGPTYAAPDDIAWHWDNSGESTRPVGRKSSNAWGLHDMLGNVWEWCSDRWARDLGRALAVDPQGPADGHGRVVRGGSWFFTARGCRSPFATAAGPAIAATLSASASPEVRGRAERG